MGYDTDLFVDGDRISRQLICSICSGVLENPVMTPCEHLFCEAELLEWLVNKSTCPLDNMDIDPSLIVKPSRIIMNMLNELMRYCPNKEHGCEWTGEQERLRTHLGECEFIPRSELYKRIERRDKKLRYMSKKLAERESEITKLKAQLKVQSERLAEACVALSKRAADAESDEDDEDDGVGGRNGKATDSDSDDGDPDDPAVAGLAAMRAAYNAASSDDSDGDVVGGAGGALGIWGVQRRRASDELVVADVDSELGRIAHERSAPERKVPGD